MTNKVIGYVRVSTFEQNPERQLHDIKLDRVFTDRVSGKTIDRPQLKELLKFIREGDTLIVHSLDRLARNLPDLRKLVTQLTQQQIKVQFIKEQLTFTGDDSPMANLLLSVMGAFAEFERALLRERQLEGIQLAKHRGVYKGRKASLNVEEIMQLQQRAAAGIKKAHLAREFGISRESVYKYLRAKS